MLEKFKISISVDNSAHPYKCGLIQVQDGGLIQVKDGEMSEKKYGLEFKMIWEGGDQLIYILFLWI